MDLERVTAIKQKLMEIEHKLELIENDFRIISPVDPEHAKHFRHEEEFIIHAPEYVEWLMNVVNELLPHVIEVDSRFASRYDG